MHTFMHRATDRIPPQVPTRQHNGLLEAWEHEGERGAGVSHGVSPMHNLHKQVDNTRTTLVTQAAYQDKEGSTQKGCHYEKGPAWTG